MTPEDLKECLPNPKDTVRALDEYVIGQDQTKKTLALMLLNRGILKLKRAGRVLHNIEIQKSNILLLGSTGTGKTHLMKTMMKVSDVPVSLYDVTDLTASGYVGGNVEDILINHVNVCQTHTEQQFPRLVNTGDFAYMTQEQLLNENVETGIIYLDEVDKICSKGRSGGIDYGDQVQNELLKVIESGNLSLASGRRNWPTSGIKTVKTDDIIFVCGGAFAGLIEIIQSRLTRGGGIGFTSDVFSKEDNKDTEIFNRVLTEDLIKYGFKPEFLGRIPLRAVLKPLDTEALISIMTKPKNNLLDQYQQMFSLFNVRLRITPEALRTIAKQAQDMKTGARALKGLFNKVLSEDFFDIFDHVNDDLIITKKDVEDRCL